MRSIKDWCKYIATWRQKKGFETKWKNIPEKLMLTVTELSEAMEAFRHIDMYWSPTNNAYMPFKSEEYVENFKEELCDATIRIFDLAGSLDIDLEKEIAKKMKINQGRPIKHGKNC